MVCDVVENEEHAIFHCSAHRRVRNRYREILHNYNSVSKILNPLKPEDMKEIASLLRSIEKNMDDFKLIQ